MGKKIEKNRSKTLPSSPSHSFSSSSSSDFEFRISLSPRKSSAALCPADELFYKGQLLPLHLSPRISMVRTLILASSSTSSSDTTASRHSSSSTDSSSDLSLLAAGDPCCDSSRPSSATDDDTHLKLLPSATATATAAAFKPKNKSSSSSKYFSLSRFSNVFKKDAPPPANHPASKRMISSSAKEVIRKYLMKVKPLYEKLSQKRQQQGRSTTNAGGTVAEETAEPARSVSSVEVLLRGSERSDRDRRDLSFSGNLKCPRMMMRRSYVASCPSSMRSSPSHSGVLSLAGFPGRAGISGSYYNNSETSTMEELQNAIQGAIAHCKNSMLQTTSKLKYTNNNYNDRDSNVHNKNNSNMNNGKDVEIY